MVFLKEPLPSTEEFDIGLKEEEWRSSALLVSVVWVWTLCESLPQYAVITGTLQVSPAQYVSIIL